MPPRRWREALPGPTSPPARQTHEQSITFARRDGPHPGDVFCGGSTCRPRPAALRYPRALSEAPKGTLAFPCKHSHPPTTPATACSMVRVALSRTLARLGGSARRLLVTYPRFCGLCTAPDPRNTALAARTSTSARGPYWRIEIFSAPPALSRPSLALVPSRPQVCLFTLPNRGRHTVGHQCGRLRAHSAGRCY